jgi:neutral ceramidase
VHWPETVDALAQTFRIGDLGFAALPFEVFTEIGFEIGFEIQQRSPFKGTIVIELANGGLG